MKKDLIYQMKKSRSIILIILCLICYYSGYTQTWHALQKSTQTIGPGLYQLDSPILNYFRLGNFSGPTNSSIATFHLRDYITSLYSPMLETDAKDANNSIIGSIKHLILTDTGYYAIWQQGSEFKNYFDGDIVCNSTLGFNGQNSGIWIKNRDEGFPFRFSLTVPDPMVTTPLTIKWNAVIVHDLLECNNFLLHDNAGSGRVLISDAIGNGMWTDASSFNDNDWLESKKSKEIVPPGAATSLYVNPQYKKVGIGTDEPLQKLHIVNGNILISRQEKLTKEFGSLNGSILFGEVASKELPNGEWGIEYYNPGTDFNTGGLNFWKVGNDLHQGSNYNLFLRNDSHVGIGTEVPMQKLHVLDGNILISRSLNPVVPGGSILFGNFVNSEYPNGEWGINYYSRNEEFNTNGLDFWKGPSANGGESHFSLYLRNDGNIGIGTQNTCGYKLAVKGKILCTELKVQLEEEWCDYVFDKSYKLMPLYDVEKFIEANHHLPEVPSADEVKTNGLNVGEMNTVLMKKVEELTLYAIDQQKQIINQQKQIDELKSAIQNK